MSYCNGVQLSDTASTAVYLATYPKSDEIRVNCTTAFDPIFDGGSFALTTLAGILDRNIYAASGTLYTVWPAGCDDIDAGAAAAVVGTTVPDGGTTVAAAITTGIGGATNIPGPVYGIVTYIDAPYSDLTGGHSGQAWIQDLVPSGTMPPAGSGVSIYFPTASANDAGATAAGLFRPRA